MSFVLSSCFFGISSLDLLWSLDAGSRIATLSPLVIHASPTPTGVMGRVRRMTRPMGDISMHGNALTAGAVQIAQAIPAMSRVSPRNAVRASSTDMNGR